MLPRQNRLTYQEFWRNPLPKKTFFSSFFRVFQKPSFSFFPKIAVFVPKFLEKRAVYRHKTKRLILETIRPFLPKLKKNQAIFWKVEKLVEKGKEEIYRREVERILTIFFSEQK